MCRVLLVALVALAPSLASAQPAAYDVELQRALTQFGAGEIEDATRTLTEAVALDGTRPEAPYYLAASMRAAGNLEGALTAFERAAEIARSANAPRWEARALHGVASTLERFDGRLEDARTAWQAYARFADANPRLASGELARARIQAIDIMNEQERAYVEVRQRIAEREREAARD